MTKHTPGPWTCRPGANDANVFYDSSYQAVGTAYFRENEAEMLANRALLAAAPDLLAALKVMYGYHHDNECKLGDDTAECLMMRAAIAKAEGK